MEKQIAYGYGKDFVASLKKLNSAGGKFQKAAETIYQIMGKFGNDNDPFKGIPLTNHGESRIQHCMKYDLTGFCRLVTIKNSNICILLYAGNHDSCSKWLDSNRGKEFHIDEKNRVVEVALPGKTYEKEAWEAPTIDRSISTRFTDQLSNEEQDTLFEKIARSTCRELEALDCTSKPNQLLEIMEKIEDEKQYEFIFDVFSALMEGSVEQAKRRIKVYTGEIREIEDETDLVSSEDLQLIPTDSPDYIRLFTHFVQTANYKDWMLFMHPAQTNVMEEDFTGSAKLIGVSGSGKTCIVVKRAVRLAKKYQDKVLVLTLNRSLSILINELVDEACPSEFRHLIEVKPFFNVCQELLSEFEPGNERQYVDITWKGEEHIDEIWREFYRCQLNNNDAAILQPIHDSLICQHINAEDYLRSEFDWIRSAVAPNDRESYLNIERIGRSFPFSKPFRRLVLDGLSAWERKMRNVGAIDYLGLATALYQHAEKILPKYRCVLVDESQDFGTIELTIVAKLVTQIENALFLCGDAAQQVSTKFQSLKGAGINIASNRTRKIYKNYRNSAEVLSAAFSIFKNNVTEEGLKSDDFEILDPEFANFSGPTPLLLEACSVSEEINSAIRYVKEEISRHPSWKACIAFCGYSHYEIQNFGKVYDFRVLDGMTKIGKDSLYLSDLEQSKGFEFDLVIIINASVDVIPNRNVPDIEKTRDLARFYVAMTRAKSQLIISYSNKLTDYIQGSEHLFMEGKWEDHLEIEASTLYPEPAFLDSICESAVTQEVALMTGDQFLYSKGAIGLSPLLVEKLRLLVDGKAVNRSGHLVKWRNIGSAFDSISTDVVARQTFGPEGWKAFKSLCEQLDLDESLNRLGRKNVYLA